MSYHPILERLYCFHREHYRQCHRSAVAVFMSQVTFCNDSNVMHIFTVYSWMAAKNLQWPYRLWDGWSRKVFHHHSTFLDIHKKKLLQPSNTDIDIETTNHKRFYSQTFDKYSSMFSTFNQTPQMALSDLGKTFYEHLCIYTETKILKLRMTKCFSFTQWLE